MKCSDIQRGASLNVRASDPTLPFVLLPYLSNVQWGEVEALEWLDDDPNVLQAELNGFHMNRMYIITSKEKLKKDFTGVRHDEDKTFEDTLRYCNRQL